MCRLLACRGMRDTREMRLRRRHASNCRISVVEASTGWLWNVAEVRLSQGRHNGEKAANVEPFEALHLNEEKLEQMIELVLAIDVPKEIKHRPCWASDHILPTLSENLRSKSPRCMGMPPRPGTASTCREIARPSLRVAGIRMGISSASSPSVPDRHWPSFLPSGPELLGRGSASGRSCQVCDLALQHGSRHHIRETMIGCFFVSGAHFSLSLAALRYVKSVV